MLDLIRYVITFDFIIPPTVIMASQTNKFGLLGYKSPAMTCIVVADKITYVQVSLLASCL